MVRVRWSRVLGVVGAAAFVLWFWVAPLIVAHDGASLDPGETCQYLTPTPGGDVWQGTYTVEEVLPDGRFRLSGPGGTVIAEPGRVAPVNRW